MGEKGEGSGGKGGGNWEWGTPLSTPSSKAKRKICIVSNYMSKFFRVGTCR